MAKVYVVCLASYNQGDTHGEWLDVDENLEDSIEELLSNSSIEDAEEWEIHDWQGLYDLNIDKNIDINELIELGRLIDEYGESYANYAMWCGDNFSGESNYLNSHQGIASSKEEFIQDLWEDIGTITEMKKIGIEFNHIDWNYLVHEYFDVGSYTAILRDDNLYDIFISQ
jgi:antirestriction protein